jgi:hypothetical protein
MKKYKNLGGKSAVAQYEVAKDSVTIRFTTHAVYIYTNQSAGSENIRKMKTLALAGKGLSAYIENNVKDRFLRKVR